MASFDDVDIFGPPAPLPDIGYGLEPMEPTPAMQRRDTVAKYLQKIGYEPRRSYQMAEKMVGTGELVGEFLPGTSKALAEERDDVWGERLSYLDLLGPAGAAVAIPVKAAKKGIKSLSDAPRLKRAKDMGFDVDNPVYHGTYAKNIDEFKEGHIGSRMDEGFYGRGHYFTDYPGEASYYGPNVGKYFVRGKFLDLTPTKKNSNFNLEDIKYFKFWTKELDKLDMLDEPTKKGLVTLKKIDKYIEDNIKVLPGQNSDGTTGWLAQVTDPTRKAEVWKDSSGVMRRYENTIDSPIRQRGDGKEFFETKEEAIEALKRTFMNKTRGVSKEPLVRMFPHMDNVLFSLSDYIRVGGKSSREFTEKASKAGYDGIKVGDETVVFNPKNIRSVDAKFDPTKAESAKIAAGITGVAGAGVIGSTLDEPLEGNTREIL